MLENKDQNVAYMKEYLRYAVAFEKYVYIWKNAMNEVNNRMSNIYSKKTRLENMRNTSRNQQNSLDARYDNEYKIKSKKARRNKIISIITLAIIIIDIVICFLAGNKILNERYNNGDAIETTLVLLFSTGSFFMYTMIGPVCLIIFLICIFQYRKNKKERNNLDGVRRQQEILLRDSEEQADSDLVVIALEESIIHNNQEEISEALQIAKRNLSNLYSENLLPVKYRNFSAVAKLYEYLSTGRCNTIQGPHGIYDTFETERIQILQLDNLIEINSTLHRMEKVQMLLYREVQDANSKLSDIKVSLDSIEKNTAETARNTAISAVANQQTAEATQWLKWHTWANDR